MKKSGKEKLLFAGLAAAAAALAAWDFFSGAPPSVQNFAYYADRGQSLLYAAADKSISFSMPLLSLAVAAAGRLGIAPDQLGRFAGLLLCLPAYAIGARGGRARGALFALAAAAAGLTCGRPEAEQTVYSLLLLLFLSAELERQAAGGLRLAALSGLAAGLTLLVRSPLFLFPPLAEAFRLFNEKGRRAGFPLQAALFLACAWLLLLPWARVNHSLFGRTVLLEEGRPVSNIVTGAMGFVYTIEGDARALAGLSRTESVYPWAVRTVLSSPGRYAAAVAKRLWSLFLMYPLLFLLAGAGLFLSRRDRDARFLAFFCAYFIAIHCLLSIEERYFQPLRYVLSLAAAGGAWRLLRLKEEKGRDFFTLPLLAAGALAAAAVTAVLLRYPSRAAHPLIAAERGLKNNPSDAWLHGKKGEALLALDLTEAGLESLDRACGLSRDPDTCYAAGAAVSGAPDEPPMTEGRYDLLMIKLMRELALGRSVEAGKTFGEAMANFLRERNAVRGGQDGGRLKDILAANRTFMDADAARALRYLRPELRAKALRGLAKLAPPTPKLRALELIYAGPSSASEKKELAGLEAHLKDELPAAEFDWAGAAREFTASLLAERPVPPSARRGAVAMLTDPALPPAELMRTFDTHCTPCAGPAARAAAKILVSGKEARAAAARELAGADPDNFAYSLILLAEEGFSEAAIRDAGRRLEKHPYPLAAKALAVSRSDGPAAMRLARIAAGTGRLGEDDWSTLLLAAQEAGDYAAGLGLAESAAKAFPRSSRLLNNRGVLKHLAGDTAGALDDFGNAVAADPANFSALMNLGAALERGNRLASAAAAYSRAAAAAPSPDARASAERARLKAASPR